MKIAVQASKQQEPQTPKPPVSRPQGNAKGTAPLPAQPLPHPAGTQDVIPIEQEELQMLAQEVGEADVTASDRQGGVVESETFALDPARWPEVLVGPQDVARLEMFLRNVFSAVLGHHKWRYVANDCVNTLAALAHLSLALPSTLRLSPHIIRAAKVQITRLLVYRKMQQGQHPAYVDNFAAAADGEGSPSWVREAETRAVAAVKASCARPSSPRGRGGRGRGRDQGRGDQSHSQPHSSN